MYSVAKEWNLAQKELTALLRAKKNWPEAKAACLAFHASAHDLSGASALSPQAILLEGLGKDCFAYRPQGSFYSIAWCLWHITRIEDAMGALLIEGSEQVFTDEIREQIGVEFRDTGNAFSLAEADRFRVQTDMKALLAYRKRVGKNSQRIIKSLGEDELRRKPTDKALARLFKEGVLTRQRESAWLEGYWRGKTVAGLLLMPFTRHQAYHLCQGITIKEKYERDAGRR
jgi:hypothetical protein